MKYVPPPPPPPGLVFDGKAKAHLDIKDMIKNRIGELLGGYSEDSSERVGLLKDLLEEEEENPE